ncbi:DDB1- and CUL4-associated factor homolog 1-like isoform X2 [Selaginella moellendorffii]|uniref:DDB1- and CUL4-associated factor homolog 1-like isoform X2 n=1 Tax=Selaginella moellendorffii TaxID=88036 RepID=UPI000D1CFD1B|nr:DDB1- and CUL4-associated factor homolog 1-like isoform X2 [Selaginella moellendorffii]|eukprot:XP_024528210.1 DDB1- and CUL4-associated factor homolog 1-like isoform X2 [Selaginella moellendorffii]
MAEGEEVLGPGAGMLFLDEEGVGQAFLQSFGSDSPGRDHVVEEAHKLMRGILDSRPNPPAALVSKLAAILEQEETRFQLKLGASETTLSRSSHTIGRLLVMIKEDEYFIDTISGILLRENDPLPLRAAAARLLLICVSCWMYSYSFEDLLLSLIKQLVTEELDRPCVFTNKKPSDGEILRTFAIGLFSCALSGQEVAEEILATGLPAKFMRYLRVWTFGDSVKPDHGNGGVANGHKEGRIRPRQHVDAATLDKRVTNVEGGSGESSGRQIVEDMVDGIPEEKPRKKDIPEGKIRGNHDDESLRVPEVRDRGGGKSRGKTKLSDSGTDEKHVRKEKARTQVSTNEDVKIYMAGKVDVSVFARRAVSAAQAEAKGANASDEAIKAAGDAAAELVRAAALEALVTTEDEASVLAAAEAAAATVVDAAGVVRFVFFRFLFLTLLCLFGISRLESSLKERAKPKEMEPKIQEGEKDETEHIRDPKSLNFLKAQYCVQCLEKLGEYIDILGPILQERGVEVCLELLRRYARPGESVEALAMAADVLRLVCALASHRKFATLFVDLGGIQQLLSIPRVPQHYTGVSLCLFAIASLQGVMERVCALSPTVIHDLVALAFQLLECPKDTPRRNAALFFGSSFVFRAIIDAFESQNGLRTFLNLLRDTVAIRSGGNLRSDRGSSAEVLTSTDKQITYHTCVALRQYFRASFLLWVDSLKPCKGHRGASRNSNHTRDSYKPIDVSNEATEAVIQQLWRDKKLAAQFVKIKWPALEKFISQNGHIYLLELAQAAPGEKYLHESALHALAVLQIVTLVPGYRKVVVGSVLSNGRSGMSVLLDAASGAAFVDQPEVIQTALLILVNLVCPPPAFSSRSAPGGASATPAPVSDTKDRQRGDDRTDNGAGTSLSLSSPLVGDTRISLGPGSGGPGLAASMEQGYRFAREAVRANNGIKVLLHLLYPRTVLPPSAHIRALACRVLLGLARDEAIAQILTKLQVGKLLSELLRDGSQANRAGQDRWQTELSQAALDLIGIVTNAGRASTVASEAAAPTLRRIERAAIAAATPINYHSRELLQLIHEHLLASGFTSTALTLLKEAQLAPLNPLLPAASLPSSSTAQEVLTDQKVEMQWPSGRLNGGTFLANKQGSDDDRQNFDCSRRRLALTPRKTGAGKEGVTLEGQDTHATGTRLNTTEDSTSRTPVLPKSSLKRKLSDKDASPNKRPYLSTNGAAPAMLTTPQVRFKTTDNTCETPLTTTPALQDLGAKASEKLDDFPEPSSFTTPAVHGSHPNLLVEHNANERATLDSLVVQYLKHQHRQCPAPITTLPPLSLLHPHVCPEASRTLYASYNTSTRLGTREINPPYGGMHGRRHNRHFIYSRFRLVRVSRDEDARILTCGTFVLGQTGCFAAGCHGGNIVLFDANNGTTLERHGCHLTPVTSLQSAPHSISGDSGSGQLLLSSSTSDVKLWNSAGLTPGPLHTFDNCKSARFNHAGTMIGVTRSGQHAKEVMLYDVNNYTLSHTLTDASITTPVRGQFPSQIHFSPSDIMVLWNGVLWDHRIPGAVHRFDQFTDYCGGGFHPAGNEVIINSEVWDLRTFKLLRSVPSLDQTVLTFNPRGDVIYATLRRNTDEVGMALNSKRARHPLFSAFRTIDAVDYSDIATTQVDRCVLDLATENSESVIGVVAMEPNQVMDSYVKFYEVGRRRPTDDDSDPDDGMDTDEENEMDGDDDEEDDDDDDGPRLLSPGSSEDGEEDEEQLELDLSDEDADISANGIFEFLSEPDDNGDRSSYDEESDDGDFGDQSPEFSLLDF